MSNSAVKIIEQDQREGHYGMTTERMIVEMQDGSRILIADGWSNRGFGGMYRWGAGSAHRLQPGDTLAALDEAGSWNDWTTTYQAMMAEYDNERPHIGWDQHVILSVVSKLLGVKVA